MSPRSFTDDNKISIERIDYELGFTGSNRTFVCSEFQLGWGLQGSRELVRFLRSIETEPHPRLSEIQSGKYNESTWISHCEKGMHKCALCKKSYNIHYQSTIHGRINILVSSARRTTKTRNLKGRHHDPSQMQAVDLLEMLKDQEGKCYHSGHHLGFVSAKWNCISLERKNVNVGYIKGNCCLVMQCLNTFDYTSIRPNSKEGSGWSREKIEYLRSFE